MPTPDELAADPRFPWTRELLPKNLSTPIVPEPARTGVERAICPLCLQTDAAYLWTDEHWRLLPYKGVPLRGCVILESRAHVDSFSDLPRDVALSYGPTLARIEEAVLSIGDVGRVHVSRWGEGVAHFHTWIMPRPLGVMEMRGPALMSWMEALPPLDDDLVDKAHLAIARALAD